MAVDNTLLSGTVAEGRTDGHWDAGQIEQMQRFNAELVARDDLVATVLPVGDGVLVAVRR